MKADSIAITLFENKGSHIFWYLSTMIEYIYGKLSSKTPTTVVVEAGGIGYMLNITLNTYNALDRMESGEVRLYVHEVIREDAFELYGFMDLSERQVFRLLTSVSGIGPATGRLILSTFTAGDLVSIIASGDDRSLQSVKGIGSKTAKRAILDLKDKVVTEMADYMGTKEMSVSRTVTPTARKEVLDEAEQAFVTLGYTKAMAHKVIEKLIREDPEMSVNDIIRKGLKMI